MFTGNHSEDFAIPFAVDPPTQQRWDPHYEVELYTCKTTGSVKVNNPQTKLDHNVDVRFLADTVTSRASIIVWSHDRRKEASLRDDIAYFRVYISLC